MNIYFDFYELAECSMDRKFWKCLKVWFVVYPSPDNDFYIWLLPDIFGYNFQKCQLQLCCWANFQLQRRAELKNATMGTQFSRQRACVTSTAVLVQHSSTHTSSYPRELSKTQLDFQKFNGVYHCKSGKLMETKLIDQGMNIGCTRLLNIFWSCI